MIRFIDHVVDIIIICFCMLLILYGGYGIWDSIQIQKQTKIERFEMYKPEGEKLSLEELQKINSDVFGWLTVENTHIDYPLMQGEDNSKYVNTDVFGTFSLSGSLFLDARNQRNFSEFNNIIYGHHMEKKAMFGELACFENQQFFETHTYGGIFYEGEWHEIEFFAFLHTNAYDEIVYNTEISSEEEKQNYISYLRKYAKQWKEISIKEEDVCVVLSTCTSDSTNGRHVLIGRIAGTKS